MIICRVQSNEMREKLLQNESLMLEEAIYQCKEKAKIQSKKREVIGETSGAVNAIVLEIRSETGSGKSVYKAKEKVIVKHIKCDKNHNLNNCPAYGKYCGKCNKKNHFAIVCKSSSKRK